MEGMDAVLNYLLNTTRKTNRNLWVLTLGFGFYIYTLNKRIEKLESKNVSEV